MSVLQAGYTWGQALSRIEILPTPSNWGWKKEKADWTTETSEYLSSSLKHIPCLQCRLFSFSNKNGYCVTAGEHVEKRESYTSWPKRPCRLMNRNPSKIIVTKDGIVISNSDIDTENIAPYYHAEADTRMFFHANHAAVTGNKNIIISSSDTDVVVLVIELTGLLRRVNTSVAA
jgi:hypothetical protein